MANLNLFRRIMLKINNLRELLRRISSLRNSVIVVIMQLLRYGEF